MAPHFASELWSRFSLIPNRINQDETKIKWSKDVLEQEWPALDATYQNSLHIKTNGRLVNECKYTKEDLKKITKEKALDGALKLEPVLKLLENAKITGCDFFYREGFDASLNIHTKTKEKNTKNKTKGKQKREAEQ